MKENKSGAITDFTTSYIIIKAEQTYSNNMLFPNAAV